MVHCFVTHTRDHTVCYPSRVSGQTQGKSACELHMPLSDGQNAMCLRFQWSAVVNKRTVEISLISPFLLCHAFRRAQLAISTRYLLGRRPEQQSAKAQIRVPSRNFVDFSFP